MDKQNGIQLGRAHIGRRYISKDQDRGERLCPRCMSVRSSRKGKDLLEELGGRCWKCEKKKTIRDEADFRVGSPTHWINPSGGGLGGATWERRRCESSTVNSASMSSKQHPTNEWQARKNSTGTGGLAYKTRLDLERISPRFLQGVDTERGCRAKRGKKFQLDST